MAKIRAVNHRTAGAKTAMVPPRNDAAAHHKAGIAANGTRNSLFELGAAYYPDYLSTQPQLTRRVDTGKIEALTTEDRLAEDFKRMNRQGIHTIRMGEFSWSSVETRRNEFHPERFLSALDLALKYNLRVIFCTPTATPPKWLIDEHPDILPVTRTGDRIPFGSRRHYDFHHPVYLAESARISHYYAETFGRHPAVVGWQTDNEFGCHNSVFVFTEHAARAFQHWLAQKFSGRIGDLNEAWFTPFWSQGYTSFEQIELPFSSWTDQNPHLELDFRRFSNAAVSAFQSAQVDILREQSPGRFITHNFMTLFSDLCPWQLSVDLDVAGFDHYQMESAPHPITSHWQFALMRALRKRKFYVLEQQPVQVNWQGVNSRFSFSWLYCWGLQSAFLGARGMFYFSWQRMMGGCEQYHDGIVPHDVRVPKSQQEKVIDAKNIFFNDLAKHFDIAEIPETTKDVLCIYNSESFWSHEITSQSTHYSTRKQVDFLAQMCASCGLSLTFAATLEAARSRLHEVQLLVLPGYAFEFSSVDREILRRFLDLGGKVLSLPRTAMKQKNNQMSALPLNLFNENDFYFEDYGALLPDETEVFSLTGKLGKTAGLAATKRHLFRGHLWAEKIVVQGKNWQTKAVFEGGLYHGFPAVLHNEKFHEGGSYTHLAVCPQADVSFFKWLVQTLKLETLTDPQPLSSLQVYRAAQGTRTFLYALNFDQTAHTLRLHKDWTVLSQLTTSLTSQLTAQISAREFKKSAPLEVLRVPAGGAVVLELTPRKSRKTKKRVADRKPAANKTSKTRKVKKVSKTRKAKKVNK